MTYRNRTLYRSCFEAGDYCLDATAYSNSKNSTNLPETSHIIFIFYIFDKLIKIIKNLRFCQEKYSIFPFGTEKVG